MLRTRAGAYLASLRERFPGPVVADMLCLLRIQLELGIRAKGLLLAREVGLEAPVGEDVRANLRELRYLEAAIGRTGLLTLKPILRRSSRDLWEIYLLEKAGGRITLGSAVKKGLVAGSATSSSASLVPAFPTTPSVIDLFPGWSSRGTALGRGRPAVPLPPVLLARQHLAEPAQPEDGGVVLAHGRLESLAEARDLVGHVRVFVAAASALEVVAADEVPVAGR